MCSGQGGAARGEKSSEPVSAKMGNQKEFKVWILWHGLLKNPECRYVNSIDIQMYLPQWIFCNIFIVAFRCLKILLQNVHNFTTTFFIGQEMCGAEIQECSRETLCVCVVVTAKTGLPPSSQHMVEPLTLGWCSTGFLSLAPPSAAALKPLWWFYHFLVQLIS